MDFHQLLARMQELDTPVPATSVQTAPVQECGEMPPAPVNAPATPPATPPSMSVNLNAQGMDNIEDLLKLITKVNPDMDKPAMAPLPSLTSEPKIASITPSLPPLKMLPDFDGDNDHKVGGEEGPKEIDIEIDKPEDSDDSNGPEDNEEEGFGNGLTGHDDVEYKGMDAAVHDGNDLNKSKDTFPKVAGGDNPMQKQKFESGDLRAQIRAELLQRLAEAKGEK